MSLHNSGPILDLDSNAVLPSQTPDILEGTSIPLDVAKCIAFNLQSVSDVVSFSLVNKTCHEAVVNNNGIWVKYLRLLGLWDSSNNAKDENLLGQVKTPMNCLDKHSIVSDPLLAMDQFKQIYLQMFPIFQDLIIVNRSNFANSKFLKRYDSPEEQVIIFNNLSRFLQIFQLSNEFENYEVRLHTIIDIFANSVVKEIESNINSDNHKECLRFIRILSKLKANSTSTTLELVLEFFVDRYVDDFNFLNTNESINSCFISKLNNKTQIDFAMISELFNQIKTTLTKEFDEVCSVFDSDPNYSAEKDDFNELPILLKMVENFLQNVLVSKFCEDLIARAMYIDEKEEHIEEVEEIVTVNDTITNDEVPIENGEETTEQNDVATPDNSDTAAEANEWSDVATSKVETVVPPTVEPKQEKVVDVEEMSNAALYFQIVPYLYRKMIELFHLMKYPVSKIAGSESLSIDRVGKDVMNKASTSTTTINYEKIFVELVEFYYEPFLSEFITKLPKQCNILLKGIVKNWDIKQQQQETSQTSQILDLVSSNDSKNKNFMKLDIFTGFSKIFKTSSTLDPNEVDITEHKTLTKSEANLKILTANLNNIKSLISLDLAITLLKTLKENTQLLLSLTGRGPLKETGVKRKVGEFATPLDYNIEELRHRVNITCQEMFNDMLNILMDSHIKAGFDKALARLKNYKPSELKQTAENTVDPIINFIELVNVGDLIQQMISVFYREELINTKIVVQKHKTKRDFLMANKCEKSMRKFENMLDNYVADGLNISIDVLMSEISYGIMTLLNDVDYNITERDLMEKNINLGEPSKLGKKLLEILENHVNLLTGSIDKTIVDVFQQEIGERFVGILVKLITKDLIISTTGAIIFISDLNAYYNFFLKLKIKPVLSYFTALKSISQIYLIDSSNSKDIGKLVVKIGRENGIFNQEEIYEFVTRRSDWDLIKRDVDKIMYGLGIADCVIS